MPRISILPVDLRNKIAAGEVIERPASVVKELVENAIDAGSTEIRIDVLKGGKGLIRVSDNGSGMDSEDALISMERHATSKLRTEDDLFNIRTMGFRGEALPSIASVSRFRLLTGQRDAPAGTLIEAEGGAVQSTREHAAIGTTVEVRDLFFNTPARKKFLKADSTELFHIIDAVTREALSHWEIGFRLFTSNHETMHLPQASGPRERVLQVYGLEFMDSILEVSAEGNGMALFALVTKGENFRNNRSIQYLFINRRPVKDQAVSHAVYRAYEGIMPPDRHPVFFLYLDLDPRRVDFNVHPTKREVRFQDKETVFRFVLSAVRDAALKERAAYTAGFGEASGQTAPSCSIVPSEGTTGIAVLHPAGSRVSENFGLSYEAAIPFIYLGDTFICTAGKGGLTLIDHHAAHERILYERLLQGMSTFSRQLLFPGQVRLSTREYSVILEHIPLLREMGIEADDFGQDTLIVRSLPDALESADIRGILADVAGAIIEGAEPGRPLREAVAARIACHSSVRGRAILTEPELRQLLADLDKTRCPDQCPHGRPTRLFFSLDELKRMFKRR